MQCCPEPEDRESYEKIAKKCNDYQQKAIEEDKGKKKFDGSVTKKNTKPLKFGFYKYDFGNLTRIEKDGKRKDCEKQKIKPDAHEFFSWLVQDKLSPLHDSESVQKKRHEDLLALRNDFCFVYFLLNLAWLLVVFVVQIVLAENDAYVAFEYSVPLPGCKDLNAAALLDDSKFKQFFQFNPINLIFMLFYVVVMFIQFGCMLIHRWLSFLQIMSSLDLKKPFNGKILAFFRKEEFPNTVSPGHSNYGYKDSDAEDSDDEIAPEERAPTYNETRIDSDFSQVTNLRQRKSTKTPESGSNDPNTNITNLMVNKRKNTPEFDFDNQASVSRGDIKRNLSLMSGGSEDKYKVKAPVTVQTMKTILPVPAEQVTVQTIKTIQPSVLEVLPNNTRVSFDAGVVDITQFHINRDDDVDVGFEARL